MGTPVFLLAAGLGTRLRPLTDVLPKPLLPVGDRPAIAHVLARVEGLGGPIVANAHHRAAELHAFLDDGHKALVSVETELLGTAGGLARAGSLLGGGSVLVWNADILADLDARQLVAAHATHTDAVATLAVQPRPRGAGNVGLDEQGRVVRLRAETTAKGEVSGAVFLGIHMVGEQLRRELPPRGCLVGDLYLPALRRGDTLRTFDVGDLEWHDIGTPEDYLAANLAWLRARGVPAFVGEGATVGAGVVLEDTVVGRGATVEGEGKVARSVIWPGVRVVAPLVGVVATGP